MKVQANNVLRPFNRNDWMGFGGCEGAKPEICYGPDWTVILDDLGVFAILDGPNGNDRQFVKDYSSPEAARAVAEALLSGDVWIIVPEILDEI